MFEVKIGGLRYQELFDDLAPANGDLNRFLITMHQIQDILSTYPDFRPRVTEQFFTFLVKGVPESDPMRQGYHVITLERKRPLFAPAFSYDTYLELDSWIIGCPAPRINPVKKGSLIIVPKALKRS